MKRIHPEMIEPINGHICNFLEIIIDKIDEFSEKDPNDIVNLHIKEFYKKSKRVNHIFPQSILDYVKEHIIMNNIEADIEFFQNLNTTTLEKLVNCCLDSFIEEFHSENLLIEEEEYFEYRYSYILQCLEIIKSSQNAISNFENWLFLNFKESLNDIKDIWRDFKNNNIENVGFFKKIFKIYDELTFINKIMKYPLINDCVNKKKEEYVKYMQEYKKSEEYKNHHQKFLKDLRKKIQNLK